MRIHLNLIVAVATAAVAGVAGAQTTTPGRAASAAVTPGDQNMGRTPENRSGGVMGTDSPVRQGAAAVGRAASAAVTPGDQNMGRNPENRSGGLMGDRTGTGSMTTTDRTGTGSMTTTGRRAPRADRN